MVYLFLLMSLSFTVVSAYQQNLITACSKNDLPCLEKLTTDYMSKTGGGIGEPYYIDAINPTVVPYIDIPTCCDEPVLSFIEWTNIKIFGMKHAELDGFRIDETTRMTYLNLTVTLTAIGDIDYSIKGEAYSGIMTFKPSVFMRSYFQADVIKDDEGVMRYVIGPEDSECEVVGDPQFMFDHELAHTIDNDPDVRAVKEHYPMELKERRKDLGCVMANIVIPRGFDAWRQGTKILALTDYFTDFIDVNEHHD